MTKTSGPATPMPDKKDPYDHTASKRATAHLAKLAGSKGRRLPVDLNGEHNAKLEDLLSVQYGKTAADVIRSAIDEVHARLVESQVIPAK
jgi:hypothetical protein